MSAQGSGPAQDVRVQVGKGTSSHGEQHGCRSPRGRVASAQAGNQSSRYGKSANENEPYGPGLELEILDMDIFCLLLLQILL